ERRTSRRHRGRRSRRAARRVRAQARLLGRAVVDRNRLRRQLGIGYATPRRAAHCERREQRAPRGHEASARTKRSLKSLPLRTKILISRTLRSYTESTI